MLMKVDILNRLISGAVRYFKVNFRQKETKNIVQFTSGGDDYCPADNVEGLAGYIGDNPAHGAVFSYRDNTEKKAQKGEKRIYSVKNDGEISSEIWLKNDEKIAVNTKETEINSDDKTTLNTDTLNVNSKEITSLADDTITMQTGALSVTADTVSITAEISNTGTLSSTVLQDTTAASGYFITQDNKKVIFENGIIRAVEQV